MKVIEKWKEFEEIKGVIEKWKFLNRVLKTSRIELTKYK